MLHPIILKPSPRSCRFWYFGPTTPGADSPGRWPSEIPVSRDQNLPIPMHLGT